MLGRYPARFLANTNIRRGVTPPGAHHLEQPSGRIPASCRCGIGAGAEDGGSREVGRSEGWRAAGIGAGARLARRWTLRGNQARVQLGRIWRRYWDEPKMDTPPNSDAQVGRIWRQCWGAAKLDALAIARQHRRGRLSGGARRNGRSGAAAPRQAAEFPKTDTPTRDRTGTVRRVCQATTPVGRGAGPGPARGRG
jgi:hypothetical protein